MTAKVVYFNIDGDLDYERELLAEWGVADQIELIEVKAPDNAEDTFVTALTEAEADGVVVEYYELGGAAMDRLPNLKVASVQAIGYSNIDADAAAARQIAVTNAPGFCSEDVALHTVGMLIDVVRKISFLDRSVRAGKWDPLLGPMPHRITGKKVGLVFFGSIPKLMVPMLKAIGLDVLAWAPTKTTEYLAEFGVTKVETLDELLTQSDFVSMHTPLNPQTKQLMGAAQFAMMKPTAVFINGARGAVVDEPALVAALRDGTIAAAAIDVIADEDNETSELFELENVVITPHAAFVSVESLNSAKEIALRQQVQYLVEGRLPENTVNAVTEVRR
ncbi:MAG: C-terminal binding protein [Actinobacteria bacterium HGW-Actinobacteria-2]|nr:MAG: C-terminal binding protein [Actinobacteria bacterium HGW-Actinobacteria-2]